MDVGNVELELRLLLSKATESQQNAQKVYNDASVSGQEVDRTLVLSYVREQKEYETQAAALRDRSRVQTPLDQTGHLPSLVEAKISRIEDNIFLSGYDGLSDDASLQAYGITHILSACSFYHPSKDQQQQYVCHVIPVLDSPDQDLLQYITRSNEFLSNATRSGKVLIHCHAGLSRSAAILTAFIMQRDQLSLQDALDKITRYRRVQPNHGFIDQLKVFAECDFDLSETNPVYRRYKFSKMGIHQATSESTPKTAYSDNESASSKYTQIRCKKCRFVLASEKHIIQHVPKTSSKFTSYENHIEVPTSSLIPSACAHFFLEPIRWMKTELEKGELEGRFICPGKSCGAKIGSYKWHGMTCSCHTWVLPALCIQRSKVDELRSKTPAKVEPARRDNR